MISGKEGTGRAIMKSYKASHYPTIMLVAPDKRIVENAIEYTQPKGLEALVHKYVGATEINSEIHPSFAQAKVKILELLSNSLTISVSKDNTYTLTLYSLLGRKSLKLVEKAYLPEGTHTLRCSHQLSSKGVYILHMESNIGVNTEKVVF